MDIKEIRSKYPQYNDLSDEQFATAFHKKFYADIPYEDFSKKIGLSKPVEEQKPETPAQKPVSDNGFFSLPKSLTSPTPENIAGDPFTRFAIGSGENLVGAAQMALGGISPGMQKLANQYVFNPVLEQFKRTKSMGNPEGHVDMMNIAGAALNPAGLSIAKTMGPAATIGQKIKQGSVFGAAQAATTPTKGDEDFATTKLGQVALGGTIGAAIPGIGEAAKFVGRTAKDMITAFLPNGAERLATKYANEIVGPENMQRIVADIQEQLNRQGTGSVPGYKKTVGEMVSNLPEASPLLALQQGTGSTARGVSAQFGRRALEQKQAISDALRPIAGTPEQLALAEKLAKENAAQNYGRVMGKEVSLAADTDILGQQIASARGIPWTSDAASAFSGARNKAPYTGQAGALQQAGVLQTEAAQQLNRANQWFPVPGMPRAPGKYSLNMERVPEAAAGAKDALQVAASQGRKADFLERWLDVFKDSGALTTESAAPLMQRPSMQNAIAYASNLAKERGYKFPKSLDDNFTVQNLHDIKLGLDAQIRKGAAKGQPTSLDNSTLEAINGTKSQFIKWLESKVPGYGEARVNFAKDMGPVNRMQVGQALESKLTSPTGTETPGHFLRTIADEEKAVKTILGQPRSDFGSVFNPKERATINDIGGLLEGALAAKRPLQPTVLSGRNVAEDATASLPSILSRPVVIANWALKTLTSGKSSLEARVDAVNAYRLLNPEKFVEAMKTLPPSEAKKISDAFAKQGISIYNQGLIAPTTSGLLGLQE